MKKKATTKTKKGKGKKNPQPSPKEPKSVQKKDGKYDFGVSEFGHVHCYHTEEVAHTRADICCRCGYEKLAGVAGPAVGT